MLCKSCILTVGNIAPKGVQKLVLMSVNKSCVLQWVLVLQNSTLSKKLYFSVFTFLFEFPCVSITLEGLALS